MTYADNYNVRTAGANATLFGNALDGLLATAALDLNASLINTTSVTPVDYTSGSVSITTASGEVLVVLALVECSHGTDQGVIVFDLVVDGVQKTRGIYVAPVASTSGNRGTVTIPWMDLAPSPGAHTIKIQWYVGAGTGYSAYCNLFALSLQNS